LREGRVEVEGGKGGNSYFINNKPIFLKLRMFTNFNTVFPVVVLVFDFEEFSEEVLHGH
jgi:hypothetical protein